jgi:gingipain R
MMRSIFTAVLVFLCAVSFAKPERGFSAVYEQNTGTEFSVSFTQDDVKIVEVNEDGIIYSKILNMSGVPVEKKGYAELPVISASVQLGDENDAEIVSVDGDYTEIQLKHPMLPSRGTIYRSQNPDKIPYNVDPESVTDNWYPEKLAYNTEPFIFRDTRGVSVYVHPVQYNSVKGILRIYKNMTVVLREVNKSTNPLIIKPSKVDPSLSDSYRSLYINYNDSKFANQIGQHGEILVIYTSRDASAIQPYITWKQEKGFTVNTIQVSTGTNVKTTIQNAYNSNPDILYVQLVGDWADIKSDLGTSQNLPMDPMLGCVAGSDYFPELIIGRFSAGSTTHVTTQINKSINYEKNPDVSGTWYKNALGMARNEGSGSGDDGEGDDLHMERIRSYRLLNYNYSTVYQEYDGNSSYVASNTTSTIVSNRINSGIGILNYTNHGLETGWSVANYSNTHVNSLTNGNKLPFVFSVACLVGDFSYSSDCFAETWLKKDGGGAVAFFGSTISQPWLPPMRAQDYFNDIIRGGYDYSSNPGNGTTTTASDKRTTFGSITMNGCVLMYAEGGDTNSRETIQSWTIFGDASLQIRTDTPKNLTVSNTSVSTGSAFTTNVKASGVNFQNAIVSLYQNGSTYAGFTDASGNVTINHGCTAGSAKLTVTGYNTQTIYQDITVGGGSTPPATPVLASPANGSSTYDTTPTFDWNDVSGATSYTIQADNNSGFTSPEINQTVTSSSYTPSSSLNYETYYWRVKATNSYGSSSYTTTWSLLIEDPTMSIPFTENFNSSSIPSGWTQQNTSGVTDRWSVSNTASSGGSAYEMKAHYQDINPGTARLVTPPLNSAGLTSIDLSFRYMLDDYGSGATMKIQSSSNGTTWTDENWSLATSSNSNVGPETVNISISNNVGSVTYLAFVITGNLYQFDDWYVDNVSVTAPIIPDPPSATTLAAGSVTTDGAVLNGTVNANGESTTVTFEYGLTTSYGSSVAATPGTVTGTSNTAVSADISGLTEGTTYNFRVKAVSAGGTVYGSNQTFTTDTSVQPVDPPTNLVAEVDGADVSLSWTAPAGSEPVQEELVYDNNASAGSYHWEGNTMATRMSPAQAGKILKLKYYTTGSGDFNPEVYGWTGSQPGSQIYATTATGVAGGWLEVDVSTSDITFTGDFVVGFGSINTTCAVGYNTTNNGRSWDYTGGTWSAYTETYFIRAIVEYSGGKREEIGGELASMEVKKDVVRTVSVSSKIHVPIDPEAVSETERTLRSTLSGYKVYRNGSVIATITDPASVTYTDTGLSNGSYSYYVTATYTDPTQESDPSNTVNAEVSVSFVIDSYPWSESFEGTTFVPDHWEHQSSSANTWTQTTGYTVGENTIVAAEGSKFAYVEYHSTDAQNEWMITPEFDLSSLTTPELSFWFHGSYEWTVTNPNCMLKVMQRVDGGSWTEIWRATDNPNFNVEHTIYTWFDQNITLTGSAKGITQLAFVYTGTDGAKFAVDGINVSESSLTDPRDFAVASANGVEVTLSWGSVEGATHYNVYRSTDPYGDFTLIGSPATTNYVDNPPSDEKMHFYYLTAANDAKSEYGRIIEPVKEKVDNGIIR